MKHLRAFNRFCLASFILLLASCTGSLSDEQRKKMREEMENHKIKKITDVEITEAALEQGRKIVSVLERSGNSTTIDSMARATRSHIRWIDPKASTDAAKDVEMQVMEAYIAGAATGDIQDNVQKIRNASGEESDSLLYSKPIVKNLADGSVTVVGTWNVRLSRKYVILGMDTKKK